MASSHLAYLPASGIDGLTDEDLESQQAPTGPWMTSRRMLACMVGIAISGTALVAIVRGSTMNTIPAETGHIAAIRQKFDLSPANLSDPCDGKPQIKLSRTLHSNLGNKGPDTGDEGIVFPGVNMQPGNPNQDVLVVVNATNNDVDSASNGMWGKYAGISAKGGTKVHANFSLLDKNSRNPVILRELDITFFDLDRHGEGQEVEYIRIKKPDQYFLTKPTLVEATESDDGYVTFKATKNGNAADNPADPLLLTVEQKQKAVTVVYKDTNKFEVEMGSEGIRNDPNYRGFIFVFRPSLLCARTIDGEDPTLVPGRTTTTTTVAVVDDTTTSKGEDRTCLFVVPIVSWCFPKFW